MIEINLLQAYQKRRRSPLLVVTSCLVTFLLLICAVLWWQTATLERELEQLETEREQLNSESEMKENEEMKEEISQLEQQIEQIEETSYDVTPIVQILVSLLPNEGEMTSFQLISQTIEMNVDVNSLSSAADYLRNVEEEESFSDIRLLSITQDGSIYHAVYQVDFQVRGNQDETE
ncbi:hypothetical protein KO561_11975 [Radiobacillus kanasensis]|uniref:PilN domain-containing protein n=1 Tax=Radiobacillus kanasensis TaxID=2844358 RepID=UPI001E2F74BB|nr:hypothetical protein [Radiobacillus kanasensis]UFT97926.1 hypothetical protein KO561_11975 [Radiobacillus kanasensis]